MTWFLSRENTPCSQRSWNRLQPSPMNSALHKPLQYQVSLKNVLHIKRDPFNRNIYCGRVSTIGNTQAEIETH